ncbi:uncharacterized protein CANTADRAFT_47866 [Suhomyces tanzawaensis NRRL Y-17324]|uniref:S-adenosyl-L-methionine-dependent methyltransferase n=1 Tax=Suhomyces tanzawaensis NRRL Y-17324 TaxID=984487 RepID=A0A1E4SLR7_9ASCO|nr:uncharacterized protein CANTADRAFT_47866 [Suhomyces tanzawaensis NRRL Y-17324]ODV80469.1 hypothetical protein CANTADRAFT_47866 [Suhomyces tanzawaensis NRRL Y-17324]
MKVVSFDKLVSWVGQRVSAKEIFSLDHTCMNEYAFQQKFVDYLSASRITTVSPYYVQTFLRRYIELIERSGEEMAEELYEIYCGELLGAKQLDVSDKEVITYHVGGFGSGAGTSDHTVKIYEAPRLISGSNTTGLRTWEAALYLSNYLNTHPYDWSGKTVLELGGGTGLLSLALTKQPLKEIIITDGSAALIDNLSETLHMNAIDNGPTIKCHQLLWGTTNPNSPDFVQGPPANVDVVVAADVTYDSSILDVLATTISDFLQSGTKMALIAATVRNEQTIADWNASLDRWFDGQWSVVNSCAVPGDIDSLCWFRERTPEIRVYEIRAKLG